MQSADANALMAISLDTLADEQKKLSDSVRSLESELPKAFHIIIDRLEHIENGEKRLISAFRQTQELVTVALDQCQNILDADNSILEAVERHLRTGAQ